MARYGMYPEDYYIHKKAEAVGINAYMQQATKEEARCTVVAKAEVAAATTVAAAFTPIDTDF